MTDSRIRLRYYLPLCMVLAALSLSGCGYNTMIANDEAVKKAWSDVEATYQRRADLIPNLVETVKAYASHERETFQAITEARAKIGQVQISAKDLTDPAAVAAFQSAQTGMGSALARLLAVAERYPDLKADQNFRDLQHQLEGTENRINVARQRYNDAVATFNTSIRKFPNNLTNSVLLHLERKEGFQAEAGAAVAPKVKF